MTYQISSDDTTLRLGTSDDMKTLNEFLQDPTPFNASRLISIPALYQVLKAEKLNGGTYPSPILEMARWMYDRAQDVLKVLVDHGRRLSTGSEGSGAKDHWQEVRVKESCVTRH